jgi:peptidoglycan hydrolase-like protein with peptidoglycan-binding domain
MRRLWIVLATLVVATGLLASPATAGDPPITLPSSPDGLRAPVTLPSGVDPVSPYLPQVSCSPRDMAGVLELRDLVLATYGVGRSGGIAHGCTEGLSEHSEGRAWDWMVDVDDKQERAAAADFLSWVTRDDGRNARRLGIMYVIYDEKIWGVYNTKGGWRPSRDHRDHVHVSFSWNGARGNVSFWTGKVGTIDHGPCVRFTGTYAARTSTPRSTPCGEPAKALVKTSLGQREYGRTGDTVRTGQRLLGVKVTGRFDSPTWSAVRTYQRAHDLPPTGVLDQPTWASLSPGDVTSRVVTGYTRRSATTYGLEHYSGTTIKNGRAGKAVALLQTALGMPRADRNGYYGAVTLAAVKKVQGTAGLSRDGIVRAEEWRALRSQLG